MIPEHAVLCYVKDACAWFTTAPLKDQWGDDWNDAPYEHNAGNPYPWREKLPPYEVDFVFFDGDLNPPCYGQHNSPWSVAQINAGAVAWLSTPAYHEKQVHIPAGTTFKDFRRMVREAGGGIYERTDR
jgi:hypothetical protein